MSYLLCIETSTTNCSVALSLNGTIVALKEENNINYSHSESLHIFIEQLLKDAGVNLKKLKGVVVSKGPGSYTGLRIGVSTAKGLCYALDIPLIAINTLESLAHQIKNPTGAIIPLLDARRMEVYTATFKNDFSTLSATKAEVLTEQSFLEILEIQKVHFIGNGVPKFQNICNHSNAIFHENSLPSAKELCELGESQFNTSNFEDVAYFEPYYLKDFLITKPKK